MMAPPLVTRYPRRPLRPEPLAVDAAAECARCPQLLLHALIEARPHPPPLTRKASQPDDATGEDAAASTGFSPPPPSSRRKLWAPTRNNTCAHVDSATIAIMISKPTRAASRMNQREGNPDRLMLLEVVHASPE